MIDTVTLLIPPQQYKIIQDNFAPCAAFVFQRKALKAVCNPSAKELKQDIYKPRLTISRRKDLDGISQVMLTIELSLPKLLFGNNLEELQYKDFDTVIFKLHEILYEMGVEISIDKLKDAAVLTIHYGKNIALTDGSIPFSYIQKIKELISPKNLDTNQTNYRNSGHCFKYHCNSYEIVFYDKIHDLQKAELSNKRAVDSNQKITSSSSSNSIRGSSNNLMTLLNKLRTGSKKFEILRMEVRLNTRRKMKQIFEKLHIKNDLTLRKLYKPVIAQKILLNYVNDLDRKRSSFVDFKPLNDKALLSTLALYNPTLRAKQILQFFGFKKLLESMTLDELRVILKQYDKSNWNKLIKELDSIMVPSPGQPFEIIKKQLQKYKALRLPKKR